MSLTVEFTLAIQVHYVNLHQFAIASTTNTEVEPRPIHTQYDYTKNKKLSTFPQLAGNLLQ